jgi:hypothetical protein
MTTFVNNSMTISDAAINLYGADSVHPLSNRHVANFAPENATIAEYFGEYVSSRGYRKVEIPSSVLAGTLGMYRVFWYE